MLKLWKKFPGQLKRLILIFLLFVAALMTARHFLIPHDYGQYGNYRGGSVHEIANLEVKYAGQIVCVDCHDDIAEIKFAGYHKNVACEVCHGPGAAHVEDSDIELTSPRGRDLCILCHEYLPSRPTGFPQIVSESHNRVKPCISCHDPHDPVPPEAPKECSACHGTIARTKSHSYHADVECVYCHQASPEHKVNPRENLPSKPKTRDFCGKCHAEDADVEFGIPRVDMDAHEKRYVCWQCHYPHLPEAGQ